MTSPRQKKKKLIALRRIKEKAEMAAKLAAEAAKLAADKARAAAEAARKAAAERLAQEQAAKAKAADKKEG